MRVRDFLTITLPILVLLALVTSVDGLGLDRVGDRIRAARRRGTTAS